MTSTKTEDQKVILTTADVIPGYKITEFLGVKSFEVKQMVYFAGGPWENSQWIQNPAGKATDSLTDMFQNEARRLGGNAVLSFKLQAGEPHKEKRTPDTYATYIGTALIVKAEPV